MRIMVLLAPAFFEFGKAFIKYLQDNVDDVHVTALVATRRIYDSLKADPDFYVDVLESIEELEEQWLDGSYDAAKLEKFEDEFGIQTVNNILIGDREAGSAYITSSATLIDTRLTRRTQDHDVLRAYMTNMMGYIDGLQKKYKPDVVYLYAIAGAFSCALARMMQARNIPVLSLQHARIDDRYVMDTSIYGSLDPIWVKYHDKSVKPTDENTKRAKAWLDAFLSGRNTAPDYMKFLQDAMKRNMSLVGILRNICRAAGRMLFYELLMGKKLLHTDSGVARFIESFTVPFKTYMTYKASYTNPADLAGTEFIYYALHVNPEASTMHLSPDFTDQLAVIEALAKRRPLHMNIIVKEHPNMLGRRPRGFYETIKTLPGVYLVHPLYPSLDLVKASAAVASITGTVAWEAILLQKPALLFGTFPFSGFGKGILPCHTPENLAAAMENIKHFTPVSHEDTVRFLALMYDGTFPMASHVFWGEVSAKIVRENQDRVEAMAQQLIQRCEEAGISVRQKKAA